jgi:DNA-binding MurR/RpiR family transcriptional regulator
MTAETDVLTDLRRSYQELTLSQKRIAELIVEEPEFVAFATVEKLAARLEISPSTIVRFAYRLGLSGYPQLQGRVREIVQAQIRPNPPVGSCVTTDTEHLGLGTVPKSLSHDLDNLRRTISRLELADVDRAVDLLLQSDWIYVAGGFTSDSLAQYVAFALGRMRGRAVVLNGDMYTPSRLLDVSARDVVLAFSFPPYAVRTLQVVVSAREQGSSVIAVTDTPLSPVAQHADVVLDANVSGIGLQNSLVAPLALANALLNDLAEKMPESSRRYDRLFRKMNEWDAYLLRGDDD